MKLPKYYRPNAPYRKCTPGVDLPAWFLDGLKAIDVDFYPVWHKYKVMWDDIMNTDTGRLEDPRFVLQSIGSEQLWGWPLRNRDGSYELENIWHIWRISHPHGWAHIIPIEAKSGDYLKLVLDRLDMQNRANNKYGFGEYRKVLEAQKKEGEARKRATHDALFQDVQDANSGFMKKAKENMASGKFLPTNPQKESIVSYSKQGNRTKTVRNLDDSEGGLYVPDEWKIN